MKLFFSYRLALHCLLHASSLFAQIDKLTWTRWNDPPILPVSENNDYVEVVFACAKTAQGKRLIEKINKLLSNKKRLKRYESYLDRWLSADEIKKLEAPRAEFYRKHYPNLK